MAGQRRTKRRGAAQPKAACRMARYTEPKVLPGDLLAEGLSGLSPQERRWVLRHFDHLVRAHPIQSLDERTAALVEALDTPSFRAQVAEDALAARGTHEDYEPWRVAEAVLDLNQDRSGLAQALLVERLASLEVKARQLAMAAGNLPPDSLVVKLDVDPSGRGVRVACWREADLRDGPQTGGPGEGWASGD